MAKKETAVSNEASIPAEERTEAVNLTLGNVDAKALEAIGFEAVDPMKGLDEAFNAGQEGFEKGVTKLGLYLGVKTCVSTEAKKPNWKKHPDAALAAIGKVIRKMYVFQVVSPTGELSKAYYGIWHAGILGAILKRVKVNQILAVTYDGLGEPFKAKQSAPHLFTVRGKGLEISMADLDQLDEDEDEVLSPEQVASLTAERNRLNGGGSQARAG